MLKAVSSTTNKLESEWMGKVRTRNEIARKKSKMGMTRLVVDIENMEKDKRVRHALSWE